MLGYAIKYPNGTYHAGYRKSPAKTLIGAQLYMSRKRAEFIMKHEPPYIKYEVIEVEVKETGK